MKREGELFSIDVNGNAVADLSPHQPQRPVTPRQPLDRLLSVEVDTSVLVELERGRSSLQMLRVDGENAPAAVATISVSETLTGPLRSVDAVERQRRLRVHGFGQLVVELPPPGRGPGDDLAPIVHWVASGNVWWPTSGVPACL